MKNQFCLSSTASFEKINRSSTNQSPTKQTFSFSKCNRFEKPKPVCPLNTYGGDFNAKKASGTAIGYGTKSDFTRCLTVSPSSNKYNLKSFWDEGVSKKKGPGFGLSRDQVSFNSYIPKDPLTVPSAVQYQNQKMSKVKAPVYSLRQKTMVIDKTKTIQPQNKNPGPGSYLNPQLDYQKSSKNISKFQNLSYSQSKSRRFESAQKITPGPGKYKDLSHISKTGTYVLSQNIGGTKAKFDKDRRQSLFDKIYKKQLENPGPGYYQAPSEFGLYDGDIYKQFRESKRSKNGWTVATDRVSYK